MFLVGVRFYGRSSAGFLMLLNMTVLMSSSDGGCLY